MRLQLAIDTQTLSEAEALVAEVRDLVDVVEVGTPLVIREGVGAVRRLREAFPELTLLADLKIADGGHLEATLGFEAGARIVTVLAAAADETIRETLRAAREHGGEVMVDLMGVPDLEQRAAEVDRLGVRWVCLHTAVDVQRGDADAERRAVEGLRRLKDVLAAAGTAVAGGITPATAASVAVLGPDILVVGSAIARAKDPRAAAVAVRRALEGDRK